MKAVVLGLGASGEAAARLLVHQGHAVTGVDQRTGLAPIPGVHLELGEPRIETFTAADLVVVSPGVPPTHPGVVAAEAAGIPVWSELALALDHLGDVPVVGITGTNGKSTVTHFTGQLLAREHRVFVGGNLGVPVSQAALEGDHDVYVLETSSYQLERPGPLRPHIGVILNLTPDHLARHGTMEGYAAAKAQLFDNLHPDDVRLVAREPLLEAAVADKPGFAAWIGEHVRRDGETVHVDLPGCRATVTLAGFTVAGQHNRDNAAVAVALALYMGASPQAVQDGIPALTALDHRMATVPTTDGLRWIDDSKSTNVDSTLAALRGRTTPTVLLLGGEAKGPGFSALTGHLEAVKHIVCFGGSGRDIHDELSLCGVATFRVDTLEEAVAMARGLASTGDDVLLSPGCASFDAFTDFTHRGRVFAALARGDA
jgi:UDP-N-acetylmuramoylalanine--D-glutamate ligase